jgi:tripeptide aminopeptidase
MTPAPRSSIENLSLAQQEIARLAELPKVRKACEWFRQEEAQFARWQLELAAIPAPPFGEGPRAAWLAERFHELGLRNVHKDSIGNVIGQIASPQQRFVSISAHLDTVFPASTELDIRRQGQRLYGPGVSDNAAGVVAMLAMAAAFERFRLPHQMSLVLIGNVGEEGEGDLRGMRHIFFESEWKQVIASSVILDGAGCDTIVAEALGSRRFEITIRGPGGHSWSDFGAPNPIVALSRAVHRFSQTRISSSPKTTFNIGVIRGGTSVNSIPESAAMRVDIRSTSSFEIERLEMELRRAIEQGIREEESRGAEARSLDQSLRSSLEANIQLIGDRPGGQLDSGARIVQIARAVDAHLGNHARIQRASTDANIPISIGRQAIAVGAGGSGGGAHTLQEWFDATGRELGLDRILLIVLALAATTE